MVALAACQAMVGVIKRTSRLVCTAGSYPPSVSKPSGILMLQSFNSPRALLHRSQDHLRELDYRFHVFLAREPYDRIIKPDPETGDHLHTIFFALAIPDAVTVVAYDVVNTLRSALDHAVYASDVAFGSKGDPGNIKFPFGDNAEQVRQDAEGKNRRGKDRPCHSEPAMREFLIGLGAHGDEGRHKRLWALNKLRNKKNHRALIQFGVSVAEITVANARIHGGTGGMRLRQQWNDSRNEFLYMITRADALVSDYLVNCSIFMEIGETEFLAGMPAVDTFREISGEVTDVIGEIEAETERLLRAS
jgi:hypothetical protein